jgi:hypothetical protein
LGENHDFHLLRLANGEHQFRAEPQQAGLVGDHQPSDLTPDDGIQKPFQALLGVVHARTQVGNNLKCPALPRAEQFQDRLLPFQVILLVVAGDSRIGNGAPVYRISAMKPLGAQLRHVIAPVAAGRMFGNEPAFRLPASPSGNGYAQGFGRLTYAN